jgi:hypothetical protein
LALLARDTNVENGVAPRAGLSALKQCGGITVVQDPSDAAIRELPTTTLTRLEPDHVVGLTACRALKRSLKFIANLAQSHGPCGER